MLKRDSLHLTKIIATVGPASAQVATLVRLIEEGARVFRINFSHGSSEDHAAMLEAVRQAGRRSGVPVGVLGDLSGPKTRIGKVVDGGMELRVGDEVHFQRDAVTAGTNHVPGEPVRLSTNYDQLIEEVQPGHRVLIDDGAVRMLAIGLSPQGRLVCSVTVGGRISTGKGVNLPDTDMTVPSMTDHDWRCVDWAVSRGVDFLALSFVRRAQDVKELKDGLAQRAESNGGALPIPVIAKIEKPQAIKELDGILAHSDAVMVARGDLGVEMDLAEVPVIQKKIVAAAHSHGKPAIVATQMLQSMIESATPTRAEVNDVANAIFDGADAVMLSGETAVGRHPDLAVATMARIARTTQRAMADEPGYWNRAPLKLRESRYRTAALAHGVSVVVRDLGAKLVVTWSERAGTARYLSQNRLPVPIIAATSSEAALRQMALLFGVRGVHRPRPTDASDFLVDVDRMLLEHGWAQQGDSIVMALGVPIGQAGVTNRIMIHYVGDALGPAEQPAELGSPTE